MVWVPWQLPQLYYAYGSLYWKNANIKFTDALEKYYQQKVTSKLLSIKSTT